MREILFRGKSIGMGGWLYGSLLIRDAKIAKCFRIIAETGGENYFEDVKPDTIGQYTGIDDFEGNKIFEGDIVEESLIDCNSKNVLKKYNYQVEFNRGAFCRPTSIGRYCPMKELSSVEWRIIGNVFDNPELITGGEQ